MKSPSAKRLRSAPRRFALAMARDATLWPIMAQSAAPELATPHPDIHPQVAERGVDRVGEGRRAVALDQEMPGPGEGVGSNDPGQQQRRAALEDRGGDPADHVRGPDEVEPAGQRVAMLRQVIGPE